MDHKPTIIPKPLGNIVVLWLMWHFYEMPVVLLKIWGNYLAFINHFFALSLLLQTLFSPWKRYSWKYPKGFRIGEYIGVFISNIFSRCIGFLARVVLICIGSIIWLFVVCVGAFVVVGCILWPMFAIGVLWLLFS